MPPSSRPEDTPAETASMTKVYDAQQQLGDLDQDLTAGLPDGEFSRSWRA